MKKTLQNISLLVIALFIFSMYGWMVHHISTGTKKFGFLTKPIKHLYGFPDLFFQSVEEVKTLPKTFIPTPNGFTPINNLEADFVVLTTYSDKNDTRSIVLLNLLNDSVLYKWNVNNSFMEHDRIWNPILFPDKSLVYSFETLPSFQRIDSVGNVIWKQDSIRPHHSMELDKNGDIWICSFEPEYYASGFYKLDGRSVFYIDNCITKVDAETGRILYHKSMTDILRDNNMGSYILRSQDVKDPIHINDVQPALKTTRYYREGDVFISSRQLSFVMHFRPSTNRVINMIEGPFTSQHDVDFLNDTTLVIFNNNFYNIFSFETKEPPKDSSKLKIMGDFYSNIVRYDFYNDSISFIGDSIFRANKIFTNTEGLMEFIDETTYFVEEQNTGLIWIIKDDEVIYKNVFKSQHEGYHHLPNWTRIIKHDE